MQKLLEATRMGDKEKVVTLLKDCQTVDIQDDNKMTPLHWAVSNKNETIVELLLGYGANSNLQDCEDRIPLHYAMEHTDTVIAELLMQTSNINAQAKGGETPLHCAAFRENHEMMLLLLSNKADINARDYEQKTPLHWAAINKNTLVVNILLLHKADVNVQDLTGKTPLHWAAIASLKSHNAAIMITLLDYQPALNTQDNDKKTALHYATQEHNQSTIDILLAAGADTTLKDKNGETPFTWAAQYGEMRLARRFIAHRASVNAQNKNGMTPLHLLISKSSVQNSKALLENGADANAKNQEGRTPLYCLGTKSRCACMKLLFAYGANANVQDKNGITPLQFSILKYPTQKYNITKTILEQGANVNTQDYLGRTALHLTATTKNHTLLKLLLASGAKANAQDYLGRTALHLTATTKDSTLLKLLLASGAKANIRDNEGKTALYYAILEGRQLEGRQAFVNLLIEYEARIYISTREQDDLDEYVSEVSAPTKKTEEILSPYIIMLLSIAGMRSKRKDRFSTIASTASRDSLEEKQKLLEKTVMGWLESVLSVKNYEAFFPKDKQDVWPQNITSNMLRALPYLIDVTEPVAHNEKTFSDSVQESTSYLFKAKEEQKYITQLVSEYKLPIVIADHLFHECKSYRTKYIRFYQELFCRKWVYACPPPKKLFAWQNTEALSPNLSFTKP